MPRPNTTTPAPPVVLPGLGGPVAITNETPADIPADVFTSWRNAMTALGQGLPYHLNRAVAVVNRGHTWAR